MWSEALRVCREYLPSQETNLRRELGQKSASFAGGNAFEEARKWLEVGEVRAALDILILDPQAPRSSLIRAADILLHQADPDIATQVGEDLGARLFAIGEHALAAQVIFIIVAKFNFYVNVTTKLQFSTKSCFVRFNLIYRFSLSS